MTNLLVILFDNVVSVHDYCDEEREDDIDEEADEEVEVDFGEDPDHLAVTGDRTKGGEHVVS